MTEMIIRPPTPPTPLEKALDTLRKRKIYHEICTKEDTPGVLFYSLFRSHRIYLMVELNCDHNKCDCAQYIDKVYMPLGVDQELEDILIEYCDAPMVLVQDWT